jgi:hypothetical protein
VTVSADATCQAAVPNFVTQVSATDNCTPVGSLLITQDLAPGTVVGLGPHTVTITVKDTSGNASSCQVLFTVVDTTPPSITGMPASFTVSVGSDCQAQMPNMLGSVTATDSCTPANLLVKSQNPGAGTLLGVGVYPLTVTVKDAAGNPATATVNFHGRRQNGSYDWRRRWSYGLIRCYLSWHRSQYVRRILEYLGQLHPGKPARDDSKSLLQERSCQRDPIL